MSSITDIIDLVHPAADATGVIISDQIWILFNQEIDETSLINGSLIITGPDTDQIIGPDIGINLPSISDSNSNDQFASPGYDGIVPGTISFQKINLSDTNLYTGSQDTAGAGDLWRTKVIFTPDFPLKPEVEYTIYLAADENINDTLTTGIRSRTIFDYQAVGGNTGTGIVNFYGSYTGNSTDTYHIKITTGGPSGTAWFIWWKNTASSSISVPILSDRYNHQILDNGVTVKLLNGNFNINDEFTVVVKPPILFTDNTFWSFIAGTGSIVSIPDSTATSIIGDTVQPSTFASSGFQVISTSPKDQATNLPVTTGRIVINFSSPVDPATVNASTIQVEGRPVNGDETLLQTREIYSDLTVSGSKIIIDI